VHDSHFGIVHPIRNSPGEHLHPLDEPIVRATKDMQKIIATTLNRPIFLIGITSIFLGVFCSAPSLYYRPFLGTTLPDTKVRLVVKTFLRSNLIPQSRVATQVAAGFSLARAALKGGYTTRDLGITLQRTLLVTTDQGQKRTNPLDAQVNLNSVGEHPQDAPFLHRKVVSKRRPVL
jgi:hypothetical protein